MFTMRGLVSLCQRSNRSVGGASIDAGIVQSRHWRVQPSSPGSRPGLVKDTFATIGEGLSFGVWSEDHPNHECAAENPAWSAEGWLGLVPCLIPNVHPVTVDGDVMLKDGATLRKLLQDVRSCWRGETKHCHPSRVGSITTAGQGMRQALASKKYTLERKTQASLCCYFF